jgi:RNA polymerase sigma-70 factor (ECF subfamily)
MADKQLLDDAELLTLLRSGDDFAFSQLYRRYQGIVYRYLMKMLQSPDLSVDLCQDIFIKFWDKREELPELLSVKAYLLVMARNHAFNFLKRAATDQTAKAEILRFYPTENNTLENTIHFRDYKQYLDTLIAGLSPQSRNIFRLCRQQGKTYDETAEILGISRNTVKKHMVRTMRFLSDSVEKDLGISLILLLAIHGF